MSSGQSYLVSQKGIYKDFSRGLNVIPIWNPMSILNVALLSIILTVAHVPCLSHNSQFELYTQVINTS